MVVNHRHQVIFHRTGSLFIILLLATAMVEYPATFGKMEIEELKVQSESEPFKGLLSFPIADAAKNSIDFIKHQEFGNPDYFIKSHKLNQVGFYLLYKQLKIHLHG